MTHPHARAPCAPEMRTLPNHYFATTPPPQDYHWLQWTDEEMNRCNRAGFPRGTRMIGQTGFGRYRSKARSLSFLRFMRFIHAC